MSSTAVPSPFTPPARTHADGSDVVFDAPLYSTAAWLGVMALAATAVVMAVGGTWAGVLLFTGFASACGIFAATTTRQPRSSKLLVVVAAAINACGWHWGVFRTISGYDEIAHGFTSFTLTFILVFAACRRGGGYFRARPGLLIVGAVSVVVALGALWEVAELAAGVVETRFNSVHDVGSNAIGAALAAPLATWGVRRRCGTS